MNSVLTVRILRKLSVTLTVFAVASSLFAGQVLAAGRSSSPSLVPAGWPRTVEIPRISVRAPLEWVRLQGPKDLEAPFKWDDAGWYSRGTRPGDIGHAVVFGHLDSTCCPAVFWNLNQLKAGDTIQIGYRARTLTFRVIWQHVYANTQLPVRWMFGGGRQRALVMFTCAGIFHHDGTGYDHKLVLFARLVMPGGRLG